MSDRDDAIRRDRAAGATQAELADRYGLSRSRVQQILDPNPRPRKRTSPDPTKCRRCHSAPRPEGHAYCDRCRALNRADSQARRAALRAEGRCPECGDPVAPGRKLCAKHLGWTGACSACGRPSERGHVLCTYHLTLRAIRQTTKVHERRRAGLCLLCSRPAAPGKSQCEQHLRYMRDYYRRRKAARATRQSGEER